MTDLRKAAEQAIADIKEAHDLSLDYDNHASRTVMLSVAESLTAAIAAEPEQAEPVAWTAAAPYSTGLYAWRGSETQYKIVHVHKRPTEHSDGGVLNGSCLDGRGFYHGCAIAQWGGEWLGPLDALGVAPQRAPQPRWIDATKQVPLEADGEVFVRFTDGDIGTGWATYWHGASNAFAQWTHPDPDELRTVAHWMKPPAIEQAHGIKGADHE